MGVTISKLSYGLLEELREFLDRQEAKLADTLLLAMPSSGATLPLYGTGHLRLAQALERMSSQIRQDKAEKSRSSIEVVNGAFWEYVEVLESASAELIERVQHSSLNSWTEEFYYIILGFKELLVHRIEDLIWVFRRIEELFFSVNSSRFMFRFKKLFKGLFTLLDKSILNRLSRTEEALHIHAKNFALCFEALRKYIEQSRVSETKLLNFPIFPALSFGQQETLLFLCRFLKVLEENKKHHVLKDSEIIRTIRGIAKPGTLTLYFREYLQMVRRSFFEIARLWRETFDSNLVQGLLDLQEELDSLQTLIGRYREIHLNSYRFALSRWIVGPEPRKTRDLLALLYDIDTLKRLFAELLKTIEKGQGYDRMIKHLELQRDMDEVLHEMGQPLSSRSMIQSKAERFTEYWELADELGGSLGEISGLVTKWLVKAMRYDTVTQVFPSIPRFGELFMVHQGCIRPIVDSRHEMRMKLFSQVIRHALLWVKQHAVEKHERDLEVDEASLHETFQNFLAMIQRKEMPEAGGWDVYFEMLLDYRYLFAKFFYALKLSEGEGKACRAHFYFVDHYLEAIEMQLKG